MHMCFYVLNGSSEAGLRFVNHLNSFSSYWVVNCQDGFHFSSVVPQ
jgi:hypothetical protein